MDGRALIMRRGGKGPDLGSNYFDLGDLIGANEGLGGGANADLPNLGKDTKNSDETFFFYTIIISLLLTVFVVYVFVKVRGFLLFKSLRNIFVS